MQATLVKQALTSVKDTVSELQAATDSKAGQEQRLAAIEADIVLERYQAELYYAAKTQVIATPLSPPMWVICIVSTQSTA